MGAPPIGDHRPLVRRRPTGRVRAQHERPRAVGPGGLAGRYVQISRRELSTYGFDIIAVIGTILRDGSPAGLFEYVADGPTELADEGEPALRSLELLPTS